MTSFAHSSRKLEPSTGTSDLILPLAEAGSRPVEAVGGKARTLGRLLHEGFPVPDGVVLASHAGTLVQGKRGDDGGAAGDAALTAELPTPIVQALEEALHSLGSPLAVRSSGASEDGARSSYAGQFRTELDVRGLESLQAAVVRCWEAGSEEHVRRYRDSRGEGEEENEPPRLALLLQRMVPAEAAGVAFTADPRTGEKDVVIVEAVVGSGERLVSGETTPERWRVDGSNAEREDGAEPVLDAELATDVASLARRVHDFLGEPQDVEWALADGRLHLLQARPITASTDLALEPIPTDPPDTGFWFRDEAHFPRPFHPLFSSIYRPRYREAVAEAFSEFGVLVDGLQVREVGGWPYSRIVPPGGKDGPPPPSWLLWILSRVAPPLRGKMKRARKALREGLPERHVERWWNEWRPELEEWVRRTDAIELSSLERDELREHYGEAVDAFDRGLRIHFRLFPPFFLAVTDLMFFCRDELGWEKGRTAELLAGISKTSSEPARALDELAQTAAERDDVRSVLVDPGEDPLERLETVAPDWVRSFQRHQERYGLRVLHYDFGTPTFRERPELMLGFLRNQVDEASSGTGEAGVEEMRTRRVEEARELLEDRPEARRRFDEVLERAHRAYPVREDNEFFALSVLGLLRYASLEVGRRMEGAGHLDRARQVLFLTDEEVRDWLDDPHDLRSTAERRERRHRWALQNPGPPTFGEDPGPPPDPSPLPPEGRKVTRALQWIVENDLQTSPPDTQELAGVGASPGRYTGPVRVVESEEEFGKVRAGDVLVCPITSPTWSVLFPSIGALVTDAGGLLSHPAIIAREFGLPAVLATGRATAELEDGQQVTVDGDTGRVEVM